ncbi:hypothetical protein FACS1894109_07490 [Spirochaetia bacterium]|nr:hypothetical protein FACS1894109_07490 [Spirochaetia bacterium]
MMGSPLSEVGRYDEEVYRQVTVGDFYIGKYEVTQREYEALMGNNPSRFKGANLPVENVSWFNAVQYCNTQSQKESLTPAYTINGDDTTWNRKANGYRLPTEAEWEYACRAGPTGPFNTGNNITIEQANYHGKMTTDIGSFPPNPWGLYDMHGNVWEWCWDWNSNWWVKYRYCPGADVDAQIDPTGPTSEPSPNFGRVLRGGSWIMDNVKVLRSASRCSYMPEDSRYDMGFRVART